MGILIVAVAIGLFLYFTIKTSKGSDETDTSVVQDYDTESDSQDDTYRSPNEKNGE